MIQVQTTAIYLIAFLVVPVGKVAWSGEIIHEFPTDFDGWQQQWHEDNSPGGSDGLVTHSTERGYVDGTSLQFDMGDGLGDDGTLWIEKQFAVSNIYPTRVRVSFQLFNLVQSDLNSFQVKAAISAADPDHQNDFTTIGSTDTAQGWVPFTYEQLLAPSSSPGWVAVGIRVAYETPREYWIDRVVVTTTVVPEPVALSSLVLGLIGFALARHARVC